MHLPLAVGLELGAHQNSDCTFQPSCRPCHLQGLGFRVESLGPGFFFTLLISFPFILTILTLFIYFHNGIFIDLFPIVHR